jgi:hypothetical protein
MFCTLKVLKGSFHIRVLEWRERERERERERDVSGMSESMFLVLIFFGGGQQEFEEEDASLELFFSVCKCTVSLLFDCWWIWVCATEAEEGKEIMIMVVVFGSSSSQL